MTKKLPLPEWTGEVLWYCATDKTVGLRFSICGKTVFFARVQADDLAWHRGIQEGIDQAPWVEKAPLGWNVALEVYVGRNRLDRPRIVN